MTVLIGGADQREVVGERHGKYDALIGVLQNVSLAVVEQLPNHDVTAFGEAKRRPAFDPKHGLRDDTDPRSGGVDQDTGGHHLAPSLRVQDQPPLVFTLGADQPGAGTNDRPAFGGIDGIQRNGRRARHRPSSPSIRMRRAKTSRSSCCGPRCDA